MLTKNQILTSTLVISIFAFLVTESRSTKLYAWKKFYPIGYNIYQIAVSPQGNFISTTSGNTVAMNAKSPMYYTHLNVWDMETDINIVNREITKKREKNSTSPFLQMRFSPDEWTVQFSDFSTETPYADCVRQPYVCGGHMNVFMEAKKNLPNKLSQKSNPSMIREIDGVVYLEDSITHQQLRLRPQPLIGTARLVSTESGDFVVGRAQEGRGQGEVVVLWRVPTQ